MSRRLTLYDFSGSFQTKHSVILQICKSLVLKNIFSSKPLCKCRHCCFHSLLVTLFRHFSPWPDNLVGRIYSKLQSSYLLFNTPKAVTRQSTDIPIISNMKQSFLPKNRESAAAGNICGVACCLTFMLHIVVAIFRVFWYITSLHITGLCGVLEL